MYLEILKPLLQEAEKKGIKKLKDGTILYGHVPYIAPEAYLHEVHRGLNKDEISELEDKIKKKLPEDLKIFYSETNGISLFISGLSIHGLRMVMLEDSEENERQPFDITIIDVEERVRGSRPDAIYFASYGDDGSLLYTLPQTREIYKCKKGSSTVTKKWPSLSDMLMKESERMSHEWNKLNTIVKV